MPIRSTFWAISTSLQAAMYLGALVMAVGFGYGLWRRARLWNRGGSRWQWPSRDQWDRFWRLAVAQARVRRNQRAGVAHLCISYSILILLIGTTLVALDYDLHLQFLRGWFYLGYELVLDAAGVALLVGAALSLGRRREAKYHGPADKSLLWFLVAISATGFLVEAVRLAVTAPAWAPWSPVGYAAGRLLGGTLSAGALQAAYRWTWVLHIGVSFAAIAAVPYTRLLHLFTAPLHILLSPVEAAPVAPFDLAVQTEAEVAATDTPLGASRPSELSRLQLLALDACTMCGRCTEACPAAATGKPLSPREVVLKIREGMGEDLPLLDGRMLTEPELLSCTTCGACVEACPVLIRPMDLILSARRSLMEESRVDSESAVALSRTADYGNPWGAAPAEAMNWAQGLTVPLIEQVEEPEVLLWVGCAPAHDPRARSVARALVKVLERAGVRFGVLGSKARCTGEFARRLGDEGLFQHLASHNTGVLHPALEQMQRPRILTTCPHCMQTLSREYGPFGLDAEVVHHTQYLNELLESGRLTLSAGAPQKVTLHDSCYLARYNDEERAPRAVLEQMDGLELLEMAHHGRNTFCCGGGGGVIWAASTGGEKMGVLRAGEARATGAQTIVSSCPFCLVMLEEGAGSSELVVKDLAELVEEATR